MAVKNLAMVYSAELEGVNAKLIEVEIDLNVGIHSFGIFGLVDKALHEAKERVNSALKNSGVKPPNRENRKITINLAPADVKKTGSQYDLAIALGYLLATKQIAEFDTRDKIFLGELALDGRLRPVNGALSVAQLASEKNIRYLFLPIENADEAAAITSVTVVPLESLSDAVAMLEGRKALVATATASSAPQSANAPDFSEIKGQENAKRALTIAAAGSHNIFFIGPPGVGKSFLARAFAGILPGVTTEEAIEITKVWSAAGLHPKGLIRERPFRAPHQTATTAALVGGGSDAKPGEISLAHRGVLFLDEVAEFQRSTLDALRQPIESGFIRVSRAKGSITFPAKFIFVTAMNPCPCGYHGDSEKECKCSAYDVIKYQKRISGPLLDRIDLQVKVGRVKLEELRKGELEAEANASVRKVVERARQVQQARFGGEAPKTNSEMSSRETRDMVRLTPHAESFLETLEKSNLSPRSYYRLLKVARTIADLDEKDSVTPEHLAEAFSYRLRDDDNNPR